MAIPAFNEAGTVGRIVRRARAYAPVIVIDDGSTDDTARLADGAGATVIRHPRRRGKGAALATALAAARERGAECLITLDADGQHDPDDIPTLLAAAREHPRSVIIGSRVGDGSVTLPHGRGLAIRVTGFWVNWITGTAIADTQSGFRVYPVALFDAARARGGRFVFETSVLVEALRGGWGVHEVPIRAVPYAARPSRFHPIADGAAITAYLTGKSVARWGVEIAAAAREVVDVVMPERRRTRHARVLAKSTPHVGTPTWGAAIGMAAAQEAREGALAWWRHPRARRARVAALATLAMPVLLALAIAAAIAGRRALAVVERVVARVYDQRALNQELANHGGLGGCVSHAPDYK